MVIDQYIYFSIIGSVKSLVRVLPSEVLEYMLLLPLLMLIVVIQYLPNLLSLYRSDQLNLLQILFRSIEEGIQAFELV